jgi:hypothetical protein
MAVCHTFLILLLPLRQGGPYGTAAARVDGQIAGSFSKLSWVHVGHLISCKTLKNSAYAVSFKV